MITFSDGEKINTNGQLRRLLLKDGLYLVGDGMLVPMKDENDLQKFLLDLKINPLSVSN